MTHFERATLAFEKADVIWRENLVQQTVNAIKEDLCQWFEALDFQVKPSTFLDDLADGTVLCKLLCILLAHQNKDPVKFFATARPQSFHARDNISRFIDWMKANCDGRFESDDVALGVAGEKFALREKIVVFGLLSVARVFGHFGFRPLPQLIEFELEIETGAGSERVLSVQPFDPVVEADEIIPEQQSEANEQHDQDLQQQPEEEQQEQEQRSGVEETLVEAVTNASIDPQHSTEQPEEQPEPEKTPEPEPEPEPKRVLILNVQPGMYMINNKKVHIRVVGKHIMVRTGGGWQALTEWLANTFGKDSETNLAEVFNIKVPAQEEGGLKVRDVLAMDAVFTSDRNDPSHRKRVTQTSTSQLKKV
eukprot:c39631_g1_i1.p1 GENE.c39631_g1_i1~~c39631_g1_i1.p1  ORF type:complete len:397 (+),score=109.67 c39631_g1_i1:102-1193(+)